MPLFNTQADIDSKVEESFRLNFGEFIGHCTRAWSKETVSGGEVRHKHDRHRNWRYDGFEQPVGVYLLEKIVEAIRPVIDTEVQKYTSHQDARIDAARQDARDIAYKEVESLLKQFEGEDFIDKVVERIKRKQLTS